MGDVALDAMRRVQEKLNGKDKSAEVLDTLKHLDPLVRFNGDGRPAEGDPALLSRQRVAIEIPREIGEMEHSDPPRAREWRLATRQAFLKALKAGFVVKEFCRSIRGQQGPGAYLVRTSWRVNAAGRRKTAVIDSSRMDSPAFSADVRDRPMSRHNDGFVGQGQHFVVQRSHNFFKRAAG